MNIQGVKLDYLGHSGFQIKGAGKTIIIDPYNIPLNVDRADIILITHGHYDHCSIKDIQMLVKPNTIAITPPDAQSKIMKVKDVNLKLIAPGQKIMIEDVTIEAIPAYNISKPYHPKNEGWVGYIINVGDISIYHAGDTDKIPEMAVLSKYNSLIALLPVSGDFVMTPEEAAEAASIIKPALAIPMHYGAGVAGTIDDAKRFVDLCKQKEIKAQILEKLQ
jgi:L-ascorbate metabolism protein UlaG (beta-lactamase superfamily)